MASDEKDLFLSELYAKYKDELAASYKSYVDYRSEYYDLIYDIIQDTFLAATREYDKLKDHPNIGGWLFKACRFRLNNEIKAYRRKKKRNVFLQEQIGMEMVDNTESIIDDWLSEESVKQCETKIFALLNDTEQRIYYEFFKMKKSIKQIADETHKSESAVKSVIARIRSKLRRHKIFLFFSNLFLL